MKLDRKKNSGRNILFGTALKFYQIIVPFFMRTVLIKLLGAEYLGLNSLFSSVLQVLNMAELGVGSAIFYSMYKPIAEDDTKSICALMGLYRTYYRVIGFVILIAGLCVTPFLHVIIKMDTVPADVNVYVLYLLNLSATVASYWLFAYKNCLLGAHQRNDLSSKISMLSSTITYILQFMILYFWKNFYAYTVVILMVGVCNNIITAMLVDKMYPEYKANGKVEPSVKAGINQRIKDLFTSKIGLVVYDSADTIVISAFLGMKILAIFQNYYFILTSVTGFVQVLFNSCTAAIGNSLVVESQDKNFQDLRKFTFIISWISGFCACCFLLLYQPFMKLWVGKELLLAYPAVICFTIYFYIRQINSLLNLYKDAAGMWHEDRFRPLVSAIVNLLCNLILVRFIGIYGILLSTVIAVVCVGEPWLINNLFSVVFERKYRNGYVLEALKYAFEWVILCVLMTVIGNYIVFESYIITIAVRLVVCIILPNFIWTIRYRKQIIFKDVVWLIDGITQKKLHKILKKVVPME